MNQFLASYEDVLIRLETFLRGRIAKSQTGSVDQLTLRGCVEAALREMTAVRDWQSFKQLWRVPLVAAQTTGTVTYLASGGTYDYELTLTGATWPSWAANGEVLLDGLVCEVDERKSATVLTLKSPRLPVEDLTDEDYTLGQTWYPLPAQFAAAWAPSEKNAWFIGKYIPLEELTLLHKYRSSTGTVSKWSIGQVPDRYNLLALYVYPWASAASAEDFWMKVKPRDLVVSGKEAWNSVGTVSCTADSTTVTGSGTSFSSLMEGSIIRISSSTSRPTASVGSNPFSFQESILSVESTTSLTLDEAAPSTLSGKAYVVSDPIDLMGHVYNAFLRCCEKQLAYMAGFEDTSAVERMYQVQLQQAKMADCPNRQPTVAGTGRRYYGRLTDSKVRETLGDA